MLQVTPEETRAFLLKRVQVVVEYAKDPESQLAPPKVALVEAWRAQFISTFGFNEGGTMAPVLTSMSAVTQINDILIGFAHKIQDHESIMDEDNPSKLDLLYDPVAMLAAFSERYPGVPSPLNTHQETLKPTLEQTRILLCKKVQAIVDSAKDPQSLLSPETVENVKIWSTMFISYFGLKDQASMASFLSIPKAANEVNDELVKFDGLIQKRESITNPQDPTRFNVLYNPGAMCRSFCQQYSGVTNSLGRIMGRHAGILEVGTCGPAREGGYHYRF